MSHVVSFFPKCSKCMFSADDKQMVIVFSALYIGGFCLASWGLLLRSWQVAPKGLEQKPKF